MSAQLENRDVKDLADVTLDENPTAVDNEDLEAKNLHLHKGMDREVAKYAEVHTVVISPEENNRLFWLVNRRILTYMLITYCWETLDKNTLAYAAVMGIKTDANLSAIEYGWLSTIVYLAELIFQYPVNRLFQSAPVATSISIAVICWGIVVALTPLCHDFGSLMAVRGLLGTFETFIQPGFTILTGLWYVRGEQAQTIALWYSMNSLMSIFTGLLTYGCSFYQGVMKSWQLMYLILGVLTVSWGVCTLFWVPNSPTSAKCYSEHDKKLLVERMRSNQHLQNRQFKRYQAIEALTDPHLWGYLLLNILVTLPSGGVGAYAGLITQALGFTALQTDLLAMATGGFGLLAVFIVIMFYRWSRWTLGTAALAIIPQICCVVSMMSVTPTVDNKGGMLFAYYLFYFINGQVIVQLSLTTQNIAGGTKKSVGVAMTWAGSMAGNCIGPQVFSTSDPPRYILGFAVCLGTYCLNLVILLLLGISYRRLNKKRDAERASMRDGDISERPDDLDNAFDDLTDRENPNFRYNY